MIDHDLIVSITRRRNRFTVKPLPKDGILAMIEGGSTFLDIVMGQLGQEG